MLENFRLKVFRTVAGHLSFRKAGEQLYLTQPAVTLQIKTLEEELGAKLFERSSSGVELTAAGDILLRYASNLSHLAAEAEDQLAKLKGEAAGELSLGASTTIAQYVLPPLLAAFARRHPSVRLQVFSKNTEHIVEDVASGRFGLGLIEGPPLRRDVATEHWFEDEIVLAVPANHEWANLVSIPPGHLSAVPLVMRERGSGSRHAVEAALHKVGLRLSSLNVVMELDSTEAILSCIEAGLGVGFASTWAIARRKRSDGLASLQINGHPITRSFLFVLPSGPTVQPAAAAMKQFLRASAPSLPDVPAL